MQGVRIYLDEVIEQREREERRRWIRRMFWLALFALIAIGATYRPAADPIVVIEKQIVRVPYFVQVPIRVAEPHQARPHSRDIVAELPIGHGLPSPCAGRQDCRPYTEPEPSRGICMSPKRVLFTPASHLSLQPVIVSNSGTQPITITDVRAATWQRTASGFSIDASECRGKVLEGGARCTINVSIDAKVFTDGDTMTILVAHDAAGELETMTIAAMRGATPPLSRDIESRTAFGTGLPTP